ncbi:sulfur carrier protein ThiS [Algiphilus sp.]|uniref:sulfur carrier protein ThiS n=1 Tax=Algiphilus sp. TaxID=1872431 RepID=UPI003B525541
MVAIVLNGDSREVREGQSIAALLDDLGLGAQRVVVEHNGDIVARTAYQQVQLQAGDTVEVVRAIGGGEEAASADRWTVAGRSFGSRLLVGTGKYRDLTQTRAAIDASGAEIVTVALRRTNIGQDADAPNLLDAVPPSEFTILPNTAGCYTADEAVRVCRLARELLDGHTLVKLEVIGDPTTLYPDVPATLAAAETLVAEGFEVMAYTSDDPVMCRRLEEAGCVAVMPLAAPIGSGLGIQNHYNLMTILEQANVPILVDAGVGTASDAAVAMELGCDGVLMNTAIAEAKDPLGMAHAMKLGVQAGRAAFLAGRMPRRRFASASSPIEGVVR